LIVPPVNNDKAPFPRWAIWKSGDSAQACESERSKLRNQAMVEMKRPTSEEWTHEEVGEDFRQAMKEIGGLGAVVRSLCISTDDPRLKQ
jgi:hypothetical protein